MPTSQRPDHAPPAPCLRTAVDGVSGPSVAEAAYDAIVKGENPLDDKEVLRAIARAALASAGSQIALVNVAVGKLDETVREHIDELVAAFQPAYDSAGAQFVEAQAILSARGITGLNDPRISTMGIDIAKANLEARQEPWDIASAGYRISLATPAAAAARRDRAYDAQETSHREADRDLVQEARAAAYARSPG